MAEFSYDESPDVSAETVEAIVAEMSDGGLKPLSDEERQQRQIEHEHFLAECRERDEQQRLEYERVQSERAEAERAELERQAAIARAEASKRANDELRDRCGGGIGTGRLPVCLTTRFNNGNSGTPPYDLPHMQTLANG